MANVMIPSSISATLSADLQYNPSIHVQTVEIDRTGVNLLAKATENFVKWYIHLADFQKLCWNARELASAGEAGYDTHSDFSQNVFVFARSGDWADQSTQDRYDHTTWVSSDAVFGKAGLLLPEASGGAVKFTNASLNFDVPLTNDTPAHGNDAGAGTEAQVGNTVVTYDRVMLDSDASNSIAASTRTAAGDTVSTWSFDDSSFNMTVNWIGSSNSNETGYDATVVACSERDGTGNNTSHSYAGMDYWGTNTIQVYASTASTIAVTKPYNDAATDFIQIGMDATHATGVSTAFASGVGATTTGSGGLGLGTTAFGVSASGPAPLGVTPADPGLVDPLTANGMSNSSADDTTDSINFTQYFSDFTNTHVDAKRNRIEVDISKPTVTVADDAFTKALQQAIDQDQVDVRDVSNTQSLRYAVRDAWLAGDLVGFQAGTNMSDCESKTNASAIELELPLTVANQTRKVSAQSAASGTSAAYFDTNPATGAADDGAEHKKIYLTPIIEIVADDYYHPSWYEYRANA